MGILYYLAHGVEVPARDQQAGVVTLTKDAQGQLFDWTKVTQGVFRIKSGGQGNPVTAVRYRGHVFYIDDRDLTSKSTFMLISQILALQAGDVKAITPTLTLPVGG